MHKKILIPIITIITFIIITTIPTNIKIRKEMNINEDTKITNLQKEYNNKDFVAILEIPELFRTPILKSTNNEYYLNHSIENKKTITGQEFMDYRSNILSKQINIYGHNSNKYDIPFRKLENYLDKDFFNKNKYIYLYNDNIRRTYEIMSIKEIFKDYEHMKIDIKDENFKKHIDIIKNNYIHKRSINYDNNSNILILQTCTYNLKESFYIITAIEVN